jgi:hypothetical protein
MATVTLTVLQGLERGRQFENLPVPLTIGREEDNAVQLNDERISRCHVKIQQDGARIILTDLDSTNGTRVNGLPVQMTVLRPGDLITLGRCVLLYGSREEIRRHCHEAHQQALELQCFTELAAPPIDTANSSSSAPEHSSSRWDLFDEHGQPIIAFPGGRPPLPRPQTLATRSEMADLLAYFHSQILLILESRGLNEAPTQQDTGSELSPHEFARIPWPLWFHLLDLEMDLAQYLREIPEPE